MAVLVVGLALQHIEQSMRSAQETAATVICRQRTATLPCPKPLEVLEATITSFGRADRSFSRMGRMLRAWQGSIPNMHDEARARWTRSALAKWQDVDQRLTGAAALLRRVRALLHNRELDPTHPDWDGGVPPHPEWRRLDSAQRRNWTLTADWARSVSAHTNCRGVSPGNLRFITLI
ncbi:hypothetical protein BKA67DRAFT_654465 [Truncatella angustata]|uniref:Uncharacterized protein n=1 Tax=Truncatella angustata TaxID=152316 RepID=A0A9P8UZM5_9PEZI|nr:uncharacterized protein BKA67DRAFT_654465 [Truncatella angustata]KAH6661345.1 hypothetical protein BKA67DRAFT_654465 [Truncatella angustata]